MARIRFLYLSAGVLLGYANNSATWGGWALYAIASAVLFYAARATERLP